jgi:type II secretory pathway pseudopilin PulG
MRSQGFTLLEVVISATTVMIVMGVVLAVASDMANFATRQDSQCAQEINASQAMAKLDQELRKTGSATVAAGTFPAIAASGAEFSFVRLADPPSSTNGGADLLWNPTVYTVKAVDGELGIWQANQRKLTLCAGVESIAFAQSGRRITVDLTLATTDARGNRLAHSSQHIIIMRN